MGFVLDASIALAWCFVDEETSMTISLLRKLEKEINQYIGKTKNNVYVRSNLTRANNLLEKLKNSSNQETTNPNQFP